MSEDERGEVEAGEMAALPSSTVNMLKSSQVKEGWTCTCTCTCNCMA